MSKRGPILIIEDDPDDILVYQEVFAELNLPNRILYFERCMDALHFLMSTREDPFLIICDINLPVLNGIEFKKKIDEADYLRMKSIPFVFISTTDSEDTVLNAYKRLCIQGFFKKGTRLEEIKSTVARIIDYWMTALVSK